MKISFDFGCLCQKDLGEQNQYRVQNQSTVQASLVLFGKDHGGAVMCG